MTFIVIMISAGLVLVFILVRLARQRGGDANSRDGGSIVHGDASGDYHSSGDADGGDSGGGDGGGGDGGGGD